MTMFKQLISKLKEISVKIKCCHSCQLMRLHVTVQYRTPHHFGCSYKQINIKTTTPKKPTRIGCVTILLGSARRPNVNHSTLKLRYSLPVGRRKGWAHSLFRQYIYKLS